MKSGSLLFLLLLFAFFSAFSQSNLTGIAIETGTPGWYHFLPEAAVNPRTLFSDYPSAFGLGSEDEMQLQKTTSDEIGFTHYHFQQYHRGIPIEGAELFVHARNGKAETANGFLQTGLAIQPQPALSAQIALSTAMAYMGSESWAWEDPAFELRLKEATADPSASFFPVPERIISDMDSDPATSDLRLMYRIDLYGLEPESRQWIYVDAQNGAVLKSLNLIHSCNSPGTAETKYYGTRPIYTDSTSSGFRLRECVHGGGIETYNIKRSTNINVAEDFFDSDNYWNNVNPQLDEVATDCHWSTAMTYEYYLQKHGRDSYDGNGAKIISYVHYDQNLVNASWNGFWAAYGDGSGGPLTTLDIVGHEITHGLTWATAKLIYTRESGALNESISDIFGAAVEYFADSVHASWLNGEATGAPLRSMSNPNSFNDPDTYLGNFWATGPQDYYGVHTNSSVQNYWFFLLVEGGSGTNDKGDAYSVSGIGWESAMQIVYRSLSTYLMSLSQFADARMAYLQAAEDLFGVCSAERQAVANAWYAVGVGDPILDNDFGVLAIEPVGDCGLTSAEEIRVKIQYLGCSPTGPVNMQVAYFLDNPLATVVEPFSIPAGLNGGEIVDFTFATKADFSGPGQRTIIARTLWTSDPNQTNDSSAFVSIRSLPDPEDETISFESWPGGPAVLDSFIIQTRSQSAVSVEAEPIGSLNFMLLMQGGDIDFSIYPKPGEDLFDGNHEYSSFACICTDATELNALYLDFDLRMTYSTYSKDFFGQYLAAATAVRILLDDTELARFEPATHNMDVWMPHTVDLTPYVGGSFTVCFEAKTIINLLSDPDGIGDQVMLDNIHFRGEKWAADIGNETSSPALSIYPNPATGSVNIEWANAGFQPESLTVFDLNGKELLHQKLWTGQKLTLSTDGLPAGIYLMRLHGEGHAIHGKFVKKYL